MPKIVKSKIKRPGSFRAQYQTFGLTYSKCNYSKQEVMDFIISKIDVVDYYMVRETHDPTKEKYDPNFPYHLHCWFNVAHKPNIRNCDFFKYKENRCNVAKKKRNWIYNYLTKQDKEPYTNIPEGYIGLAKAGKVAEAISRFQNDHPKEYVINKVKVDQNLRALSQKKREHKIYPLISDYDPEWDPSELSLHMYGPSRLGKTEWAKSYVHHKLKKTFYVVTHIDNLKTYDGSDIIIYDDVSFTHLPTQTAIHIAECKNGKSIHCRHKVAEIPPGIGNIFLSNSPDIWPSDPYDAIKNRVKKVAPSIRFY